MLASLRGLVGALVVGVVGGGIIAGLTVLTGAYFTILWWPMGWATGAVARAWARTGDSLIGLFSFLGSLVGIFISSAGLHWHHITAIIFGGIGMLVSFVGSVWLAFKVGRTPN